MSLVFFRYNIPYRVEFFYKLCKRLQSYWMGVKVMSTLNVFTGKTVEEAIANGLQHLGLTKEEVSIEVLYEGRKGILKIGSKEAEVRIERKIDPKPKSEPKPKQLLNKPIQQNDHLEVDSKTEKVETKWSIEISRDRLTATLKVEPGTTVPNLTLTTDDVNSRLRSLGISEGIQQEQIEQACKTETKGVFIIAKGESPIEGKNGWLEYLVEINEGKSFKERKDGSIDYREGREIPSVPAGTTIAIIHDPIEGLEGSSVTGEVIHPKPVLPLNVKAGSGVQIKDHQIISTSMGRPSVQKRGNTAVLTVLPKFEHRGDVSLASGNLRFHGDIVISGSVENHMEVVANGAIEIRGTASEAKIKAGQSITHYSNVIASEIIAGNSERNQKLSDFDHLVESMNQLIEHSNFETEIGVFVQMPSAINSAVYSSGDVLINKQGCYNCTIFAEGSVEVNGFVRGGRLFAGLGARLQEAGSKGGTPTLICVPHDQIITIKNVFSETTIQIGKRGYKFTKDMTNIVARIDEQGNIAIR